MLYALSFAKESVLPLLTDQQKKILAVASIAFGALAVAYVINRSIIIL